MPLHRSPSTLTAARCSPSWLQACECGCLDAVLDLMRDLLAANGATTNGASANGSAAGGKENGGGGGNGRGAAAAQRQACMALRNAAVRSPEVRAALLERGAEATVRAVKAAYPACADAGAAALRDLGLNDYSA